jgi:hypothetical protein
MFGLEVGMKADHAQHWPSNAPYLRQSGQVAKESLLGSPMGENTYTIVEINDRFHTNQPPNSRRQRREGPEPG